MSEIQAKVVMKKNNGAIVSADLLLYNDESDVVKKITIVESEVLEDLQETVEGFETSHVSVEQLESILENTNETTIINATKLRGLESDEIALKSEMEERLSSFEVPYHADSTSKYGIGSTGMYGHVKVKNDLNSNTFVNGEALSAYQGKVLNEKVVNLQNAVNNSVDDNVIGSNSVSANKNDCTGTVKYHAIDFGSKIGVFVEVSGLYMRTSGKNVNIYYHLYNGTVFPVGLRPEHDVNHVCAGMDGYARSVQVCSDGTMKFRLLNSNNGNHNNPVYTHFHYFVNK
ncbi:MAG: hypothetical protein Q4P18_07310 [Methanobrevibacter sp.]|uniref:hypothetical protein n=1 Tax=Methanobrevibacter sp. TaxID=66852 RepID=UPI0026E08486|nr:hypothetical protein [Methanobrevibacter sp.]MDO5849326.1 hypothetical protein [Methanobrevibacter sp.]